MRTQAAAQTTIQVKVQKLKLVASRLLLALDNNLPMQRSLLEEVCLVHSHHSRNSNKRNKLYNLAYFLALSLNQVAVYLDKHLVDKILRHPVVKIKAYSVGRRLRLLRQAALDLWA